MDDVVAVATPAEGTAARGELPRRGMYHQKLMHNAAVPPWCSACGKEN